MWIVGQSPNDTTHPWQTCAAEIDVVNRGADMGWLRDRSTTTSTGGLLVVPRITRSVEELEKARTRPTATPASKAGGNNSTGLSGQVLQLLPRGANSAVGLTGRAIYVTGDITGTASQYPYGPLQTDGTWLHGIDHTKAVYTDSHAEVMAVGQATAWITGTTVSPTGTATLAASGSGANISLTLTPAGTGTVTVAGPANVEGNVTVGTVTSSGAHINVVSTATTQPGVAFYSVVTGAASQRWQVGTDQYPESGGDAGDNFAIYSYHDNGTFNGQALLISRVAPFQAQFFGPVLHSGGFGAFDAAATTTKPTVTAHGQAMASAGLSTHHARHVQASL